MDAGADEGGGCVVVDVVEMTDEVLGVVEVVKVVKVDEEEEDVREGVEVVEGWTTEGVAEDKGVLVDVTETVVAIGESTIEVGAGWLTSVESMLKSALRRFGPCRWTRIR